MRLEKYCTYSPKDVFTNTTKTFSNQLNYFPEIKTILFKSKLSGKDYEIYVLYDLLCANKIIINSHIMYIEENMLPLKFKNANKNLPIKSNISTKKIVSEIKERTDNIIWDFNYMEFKHVEIKQSLCDKISPPTVDLTPEYIAAYEMHYARLRKALCKLLLQSLLKSVYSEKTIEKIESVYA